MTTRLAALALALASAGCASARIDHNPGDPDAAPPIDPPVDAAIDAPADDSIVFEVAFAELTAAQPPCTEATWSLDTCLTAAKRLCERRGFAGGVGPLTPIGGRQRVACSRDAVTSVRNASFADVAAATGITLDDGTCASRTATDAFQRYCIAQGYPGGIGPTEHASGMAQFHCLTSMGAEPRDLPRTQLSDCDLDNPTVASSPTCSAAADAACRSHGYLAGWGPLSWNALTARVLCLTR